LSKKELSNVAPASLIDVREQRYKRKKRRRLGKKEETIKRERGGRKKKKIFSI
jgi:hypothetical protein